MRVKKGGKKKSPHTPPIAFKSTSSSSLINKPKHSKKKLSLELVQLYFFSHSHSWGNFNGSNLGLYANTIG